MEGGLVYSYGQPHRMLVLLLFFCSGATALVYEVLWSKYLTLMLGSTVQAQTVVLAVFMGGLALGNQLFGKRSTFIRQPLRTYAILELIIGGYAFFFPNLFHLGDWIFVGAGSAVVDLPVLPLVLKLLLSLGLLLIPTVLMGGTLPLLAAWIQGRPGVDSESKVGIFYAVNSLGAVLGAALAGFYLVQTYGLVSGLQLTALANFLVGMAALVLAKRESLELKAQAPRNDAAPEPASAETADGAWFGLLVALSGGVSMGLEVLSSRALALIAGGSLQSFALVLMSFILGIGLGSVVISSSRAARKMGVNVIYGLLSGAAVMVMVHVLLIETVARLYVNAKYGLAPNPVGYIWHQLAIGLFSFLFLGLPAALLGAVVPLAIRLADVRGISLGEKVGRLLTSNTIGAVIGVLLTGFVLMPVCGLRGALAALALILFGATAVIAFQRGHSPVVLGAVLLAAGSLAGVASTGAKWQWVMSAGLFRVRNILLTDETFDERKKVVDLVFYQDSPDATVSVEKTQQTNNTYQLTLRLNGKGDASTVGDLGTQYLLAHIPMMARPDAKKAFVLGFGSGITSGALLGHPIESLTIAENCGPVLAAGRLFAPWNRGVLTNSRVRIFNEDARSVLKLRPDRYDLIVSEPSNPWVVGVGSVFSQDFYRLCASRLTEGGVMGQWFHKYEMSDDIVFLIFRTFASVFPNMEIWDTQEGDLILLGSVKPWPSDPAHFQTVFNRPAPAKDLADLRIESAVALWARQVASQKTAPFIAGDGPVQTDEFPLLEYSAPRAFFLNSQANHLYLFDERTVQFTLADPAKITALRALPNQALLDSFSLYGPSSPDIRTYLQSINPSPNPPKLDPLGHIIFRAPESYPEDPTRGSHARTELIECVKAEGGILRDEANWKAHAQRINQVLTRLIGRNELRPGFSPKYFAALAARKAIGRGDYQVALESLRLGFIFDPGDEQLSFLSRVLDRIVPPELMQRVEAADKLAPPGKAAAP